MRKKLLFIVALLSIFLLFFQGISPVEKEELLVSTEKGFLIMRNFSIFAFMAFLLYKYINWYFFTRRNA